MPFLDHELVDLAGGLPPGLKRKEGSKLWHVALLEWWLQVHVYGVPGGAGAVST